MCGSSVSTESVFCSVVSWLYATSVTFSWSPRSSL